MPYQKRYSTPTTAQETEGALVIGFWLHRNLENTVPRVCEKHMAIISLLDQQEEARIAAEQTAALAASQQKPVVNASEVVRMARVLAPNPATVQMQHSSGQTLQQQQIADLQAHQRQLIADLPQPPLQPAFSLGPGPLTNENSTPVQAPTSLEPNLVAPYTGVVPPNAAPTGSGQALLDELVQKNAANPVKPQVTEQNANWEQVITPTAKPGTPEGALEAARMAPAPGAKVTAPCPLCGIPVVTGEVHIC
jgi:hypothetical protein